MNVATLPRIVLRAEYVALRSPLRLVEQRLLTRLSSSDPRRVGVERILGQADALAGRLLDDEDLARRGEALQAHAATVVRADELAAEATQRREDAASTLRKEQAKAAKQRRDAVQEHQDELAATKAREAREKKDLAAQTRARAIAEKAAVERQATAKTAAAAAKREAKTAAANGQASVATAAPRAALAEARESQQEAVAQRVLADGLAQLANEEKQQRQGS